MKKMIGLMLSLIVLSAASVNVKAQVRIGGNTNPVSAAILDLNADSTTSANTKGLAIPRMVLTSTASAAPLTKHVAGMLVYNTGTTIPTGFYYNTGSAWVKVGSGDGSLSNVAAKAGTGTTVSGKGIAGDTLIVGIANSGVNTTQLADSSVTNAKIKNWSVNINKLATTKADSGKYLKSNGTTWYVAGAGAAERTDSSFVATSRNLGAVTWTKVLDTTLNLTIPMNTITRIVANGLTHRDICTSENVEVQPYAYNGMLYMYNSHESNFGIRNVRCYRPSI